MLRPVQLFLALASFALIAGAAFAQDKVVYHIDDAATQATKGLRNIRNHLDVAPDTKVVVVTHANGVDFLFDLFDGAGGVDAPCEDGTDWKAALRFQGLIGGGIEIGRAHV